jgi:superfamily II DNA or RNA helicase
MSINATELRTLRDRYEAHIDDIEGRAGQKDHAQFALRPGQVTLARDLVARLSEPGDNGRISPNMYFVRPTGTGKTVSLIDLMIGVNTLPSGKNVLGDAGRGKRSLVMVPPNFLLDQWESELLGSQREDGSRNPSKWGDSILPEHVGVYRATDSFEKKCEALKKPIVLITYDSARIITTGYDPQLDSLVSPEKEAERKELKKLLKPDDFSLTLLDEVHDRPRGDVTGAFIKEHFMGHSLVIGATATHLYKSGKTIGDYLFGGQIPFHETTFRDAVNNKEICPMRNIVAEVTLDAGQEAQLRAITQAALERARESGAKASELDYTEKELERIVEITKRDEAAIRLLQRGCDPDTGKRYRDMKQVWYCASVGHAKNLANKINKAMGGDYAMVVHGTQGEEEQDSVLINYKSGKHKALTNCQLLTLGFDDPQAELCMQIVPTRSPTRSMQQGGRVMRLDKGNKHKIANVVTFVYPGIEQVVFGELAGGMLMIPPGYEYPQDAGTGVATAATRVWPDIDGLKVSYTTDQLKLFAEKRRQQRFINGLPVKDESKLTVEEMAKALFPKADTTKLSHETHRLQHRIFEPLQAAYDERRERQKYVGVQPAVEADSSEAVAAFGQRFPSWRIGHYSHEGKNRFCVDKQLAPLCRLALFGRVGKRTPAFLSEVQAKILSGLDEGQWHAAINLVKEAYLDRKAYDRALKLGEVTIPHEVLGYCKSNETTVPNQAAVDFYLMPDALLPIRQLATGETREQAQQWWDRHPQLPKLKTVQWLNRDEAKEALGIGLMSDKQAAFEVLWKQLDTAHRRQGPAVQPGQPKKITLPIDAVHAETLQTASKMTLGSAHFCIDRGGLEVLRHKLGMESRYEPGKTKPSRAVGG